MDGTNFIRFQKEKNEYRFKKSLIFCRNYFIDIWNFSFFIIFKRAFRDDSLMKEIPKRLVNSSCNCTMNSLANDFMGRLIIEAFSGSMI